ncbi:MAG: glycosyl hydrolase, partial [Proteobacteria bacterium]|nr:glycosyl hydrolase [Pseudomonadota bacterium]
MISRISLISCLVITLIACRPNENNGSKSTIELDRTEQMKQELYLNLNELINAGRFLFGQQRSTLSGVGEMGGNPWGDERYGTQADSEKLVGDRPAILGMDVWDYAMKNPTWNQPAYAQAVRDFYQNGKGGLVSFDWHMRGCDIGDVYDAGGNHGVPGDGFKIDNWDSDSNRSCLCRIVNEEPWTNGKTWKDWLYTQKLDKFATKLQSEGLDQVPMIFRPFHEMNGSWFWWGSKSWDCQKHLGRSNVISGVEAYKKLFRMSVDYLRKDRNIHNMLIAFSPDRLCKHEGHSCDASAAQNDKVSDQDLYNDFMRLYPGSQYVDILGLDLYYAADTGQVWEKPDYQSKIFT